MWAVNSGHNPAGYPAIGRRNSNGILFQPRASIVGSFLALDRTEYDLDHESHASITHLFATPDSAYSRSHGKLGAVWLSCDARSGNNSSHKIEFWNLVASITVENTGYANLSTGVPGVSLRLNVNGVNRVIRDFEPGLVTFVAGICFVGNEVRFVSWVSCKSQLLFDANKKQSAYGAGTAVISVASGGLEVANTAQGSVPIFASKRSTPWLQCFCEHYGPFRETYEAVPEDYATLQERTNEYPGARRQKQENALVPVFSLPQEDCGQMAELTRPDWSPFFVQCLMGYAHSKKMPYLPNAQASNIHSDPAVNLLLHRIQVNVNGIFTGSQAFSIPANESVICSNDGSGLNEYSGSISRPVDLATGTPRLDLSCLVSLLRRDTSAFGTEYICRIELIARSQMSAVNAVGGSSNLSLASQVLLFSGQPMTVPSPVGSNASFTGTVTIQAIGPA